MRIQTPLAVWKRYCIQESGIKRKSHLKCPTCGAHYYVCRLWSVRAVGTGPTVIFTVINGVTAWAKSENCWPHRGPNRADLETSCFHFLTQCSKNMQWDTVLMYWRHGPTVLSNWAESIQKYGCGKGKSDANNLFSSPTACKKKFNTSGRIKQTRRYS